MEGIFTLVCLVGMFFVMFAIVVMKGIELFRGSKAFFTNAPRSGMAEQPGNGFAESKLGQRLIGVVVFVAGSALTYWIWDRALDSGQAELKSALGFPFLAGLGLGMVVAPVDVDEQRWKFGVGTPRNWAEMPVGLKLALVLAVFAGVVNLITMLAVVRG